MSVDQESGTSQSQIHIKQQERQSVISYKCTYCNFTTKTINHLNTHKQVHETKNFECQLCNVAFNSEGVLTQHILNEHKKE